MIRRLQPRLSVTAVAYLVCAGLFAFASVHSSDFASAGHVRQLLVFASFIGFAALGQTLVILGGGLDLSVPWLMAFGGMQLAIWAGDGMPSGIAIVLLLTIGALIGTVNGLGVTMLRIPPIIMTIGVGGLVQGYLMYVGLNASSAASAPEAAEKLVDGRLLGIPAVLIVWLAAALATAWLLRRTVFGRSLYAAGSNDVVARLAGTRVAAVRVVTYAVSGATSTFAGILLAGYIGQAYLDMGAPYLFSSIAAVAIGGASILGGSGSYWGTVAGVGTLTVLASLLPSFNLDPATLNVVYGLVILLAVGASRLARHSPA